MQMGVPATLEALPVNTNYGEPSYFYNHNLTNYLENNNNNHHHPSGIPMPCHGRTEKAENDGLELTIAPPQPRPNSEPTSSSPGAINVTHNSVFMVAL